MIIKHLRAGRFEVLKSENSKLKPGDRFHCSCLVSGEPLYLDEFVRDGKAPTLFVAGNKGGLTEVRREGK